MTPFNVNRREFVQVSAAGAAAMMLGPHTAQATPGPKALAERPLGKTGHQVRLFSLGGQATIEQPDRLDDSVAIINRAIDLGVNYIDTAAAYGRGISQTYIGEVMATRRNEVFLATKTHNRTRDGSLTLLEDSLKRLQTDHLDLWQLHNITRTEQLDQIFGPGGAIEALTQARDEKIVRFLGITGHYDPAVLMDGLRRFPFDTILMALNAADRHHTPFQDTVLPLANEMGIGVIGMKIPARGRMFRDDGVTSMRDAMHYVLTLPVSTIIIGCDDVVQLEENVRLAQEFSPLPEAEMRRIEALTADYAADAAFFKKTGAGFGR
ncbi:MAG: aldo/keto reductase [Gemmatimonadota bacterium]|nr:aldo/keto reductase [Gemmatimonadota bacterium]MDH4351317.1 aldo/keto reductase [Gemmatimonadota bacterium]